MKIQGTINYILSELTEVQDAKKNDKTIYVCDIKEKREKRSLDANSYAWVLMDKIAKEIKSSKEEVYLMMLERYGVFVYISVPEVAINSLRKTFRIVYPRGTVVEDMDGITCVLRRCQCYVGSSKYDTKEMSDFIDGIVSEAQELGIETETPDELARMKAIWEPEAA